MISTLVRHYYEANISNKAFYQPKKKKHVLLFYFSLFMYLVPILIRNGDKKRDVESRVTLPLSIAAI